MIYSNRRWVYPVVTSWVRRLADELETPRSLYKSGLCAACGSSVLIRDVS